MTDTDGATLERELVARSGHVGEFDVIIHNDTIHVIEDTDTAPTEITREVDGLADFVHDATEFRLGWVELPDGDDVIYCYDAADDCYGYAVNCTSTLMSEWGYAPFRG